MWVVNSAHIRKMPTSKPTENPPKTENRKPPKFSKEVLERFLKSEVLVFFPIRDVGREPKAQK
jgi:hypothetical protein